MHPLPQPVLPGADLGSTHPRYASVSPLVKEGWFHFPCLPHGAGMRTDGKALCPLQGQLDAKAT